MRAAVFKSGSPPLSSLPELPTTNLLGPEGVDDGRFANIGVAHKANTDVLFVSAHAGKLAQQAQQAALAKGVGDAGMEGQARPITHQVTLVDKQQHMLMASILLDVLLQVAAARAKRVPCIQHLPAAVQQSLTGRNFTPADTSIPNI
ncbi:MAG: hypothetical protein FRX49_11546 [Trebouxia sp. A1-2]|nr:MAG: hypothetical protein FRX49_11546 [Trebouxia sp. A1-2]